MFNRFLNGSEPPDNDARKACECSACGDDICEGDTYFHIPDADEDYCASCMRDFETVAEVDDGKDDYLEQERDLGIAFEQNINRLSAEMGDGDADEM